MLEFYQAYADYHDLMNLTEELYSLNLANTNMSYNDKARLSRTDHRPDTSMASSCPTLDADRRSQSSKILMILIGSLRRLLQCGQGV